MSSTQMPTLYHYVHCPFCVRVRMAFGALGIEWKSIVLPYADEKTPLNLIGTKMLPIVVSDSGKALPESLDIIEHYDLTDQLKIQKLKGSEQFNSLEDYLAKMGSPIHSLAMPYWIYTPEFDQESRDYFQKKKEVKRGPFVELVKNRAKFIGQVHEYLGEGVSAKRFEQKDQISILDIMLASHLWGLYIVPEFQFPEKIHEWLQDVGKLARFNYHEDYWQKALL